MVYTVYMKWNVQFTNKAAKQSQKLDERVLLALQLLVDNLITKGPIPGKNWQNYSKLKGKV